MLPMKSFLTGRTGSDSLQVLCFFGLFFLSLVHEPSFGTVEQSCGDFRAHFVILYARICSSRDLTVLHLLKIILFL